MSVTGSRVDVPFNCGTYGADMHLLGAAGTRISCFMRKVEYQTTVLLAESRCTRNSEEYLGSRLPLLVAPGRPANGVNPMLLSSDLPLCTAHADAPLPRCSAIILVSL